MVHAHSAAATSWSGQTDFWNYVDQAVVDQMVDQGLMALTGAGSVAGAWSALLPGYQSGQAVAVKINCNNCQECGDSDGQIDALPQPINAIVRGLKLIGVAEADIWVYDARRKIPNRFVNGMPQYPNVRYLDTGCRDYATFSSGDPDAYVTFHPPAGIPMPPSIRITDVVIDAAYLINVPILKSHGIPGVTLGFKNHLGTIDHPGELHDYIGIGWQYYRSDWNAMLDIFQNPHVGPKTVLTLADGLFGSKNGTTNPPAPWISFGNDVPNSLLFSADPVAIDCVMIDLLAAEIGLPAGVDDYVRLAGQAELGVFERGDPWGSGYSLIDYVSLEI